MQVIKIDEEFKTLLPPLNDKTYESLEKEIVQDGGCRDPLVLWNGILIDGHNRYNICTKNDIKYNVVNKEFESRDKVMIWIISTQVSRRNLTQEQMVYFRGKQYEMEKKELPNPEGKNQYDEVDGQNVHQPKEEQSTAQRIADQYHVTEKTIRRDAKVAKAIDEIGKTSPVAKQKILAGEVDINKKELEKLSIKPNDEIQAIATEIKDGTYDKRKHKEGFKPRQSSSPADKWIPPVPIPAKQQRLTDFILAGINTLRGVIKNITDDFEMKLPKINEEEERNELKASLKNYINDLQNLYNQI